MSDALILLSRTQRKQIVVKLKFKLVSHVRVTTKLIYTIFSVMTLELSVHASLEIV